MKKSLLPPVFIVIASALYFLIASVALAQDPVTTDKKSEIKIVKYCTVAENGKTTLTSSEGQAVTEAIAFENGASVSLDGIITWKDGSKTTLANGDCVGVDNWGAVYISKAPLTTEKSNSGIISNR